MGSKMSGFYSLKTLGCKANFYDSQLIESELQKRGWKPLQGEAGSEVVLCLVNSCTVTDEADRQSRKMAARLSRENPGSFVVVTGCAAEIDPERIAASKGVHYVIGNRDKPKLVDLILEKIGAQVGTPPVQGEVLGVAESYEEIQSRHPIDREWPGGVESFVVPPAGLRGQTAKTRAFLKIQEGCNHFCTYCIIPYGRGPSRSLRPGEVIERVRHLVNEGIREVVITGTNIGDYGTDWAADAQHAELFEMILSETSLERLRLSSLDPTEITQPIIDLMAREPRLCAHFHVSLQSPHSKILKLMKRRYSFEHVKACLEKIARVPAPLGGAFVGMDIITGFPGESEEDFQWGIEALSALPWSRLHVFPYSEREGTPATRLSGSVPREERIRRTRDLNQLSLARLSAHYERILRLCQSQGVALQNVLLEQPMKGWQAGYTPNYIKVLVPEQAVGRNSSVSVFPRELKVDAQNGDVALIGDLSNNLAT